MRQRRGGDSAATLLEFDVDAGIAISARLRGIEVGRVVAADGPVEREVGFLRRGQCGRSYFREDDAPKVKTTNRVRRGCASP